MAHDAHGSYLKMFLEQGNNIMLWNYRGYGLSTGSPTPDTLREDVQALYNFIKKEKGVEGKVGIYGRSLGGIPSSSLTSQCDLAIIDRTFSSLYKMGEHRFCSKVASWLLYICSLGWQV